MLERTNLNKTPNVASLKEFINIYSLLIIITKCNILIKV